ncbi:MAG: thiamine-phosphate kinase [Schleiferiaceae bacterium]|jgi:thiamine-monophosphate kinase|nr:thiamine-phosphate kinase [Schleiferiaceae bacterium]MDR9441148.1 thiamine-phosphate kinase [Schleiferiaceae bacterium]
MEEGKKPEEAFTPLDQIGEFPLIDRLVKGFPLMQGSSLLGIGDDAAAVEHLTGPTLLSTDMLVEGVHFDLTYVPPQHLGYKAAIVNFSDIYAMNGKPTQLTMNLAISNRFGVEFLEGIYAGLRAACEEHEVDLVGGDTTSSYSGLILSGTVLGEVEAGRLVKRRGAQPTDLVVVSGDLGGAYMGLQLLEREKSVFKENPEMQPELKGNEYALRRQLRPEARRDVIDTLSGLEVLPTSMIDISDGLSSELLHLCNSAQTGVHIYEENIPIDPSVYKLCEEFELTTTTVALNGGEDYELLFTISIHDHDKIKANPNFTVIGHITDPAEGRNMVTRDSKLIPLQAQGWQSGW